jgi:uncharacterized membrane-anchored protein YhcB (DUF1043 family)
MADVAKLKEHIAKAKSELADEIKKADNPKDSADVKKRKKKVKRLTRRIASIAYDEKMASDKLKKNKKGGDAA